MNRWDNLSLQEKNQLLGIYASKGYTDLASIIAHYNTFQAGGYIEKEDPVLKDRRPKANFYQRLLDSNRQTIPDWQHKDNIATHKMSYATNEDNTKAVVYPEVQEINGKLYDFTDPRNKAGKWDALDRAIETGDTIQMTPAQAEWWTRHYKEFYPSFNYAKGGSLGKVTPYGQWQYPGKVTTIPSNNITMKGVDYPVIGVSDTGDTKYMLPNMDYLFEGQYVTEYPVNNYQSGGQLNNIPFYLLGRDSNTGVINPKSLYIPSPDRKANSVTKNKYSDNRIVEINNSANGDYTSDQFQKNEELLEKWDPTGGLNALNWFMSRKYGNLARGEENEYYRAYLGLSNDIPEMSPNAQTEWDYKVERDKILNRELESDFYGTTEKIDRNIQAMVDTLNLGKILRGEKPLPIDNELSNRQMRRIYKTGKEIMENPNKWIQVDFDETPGIEYKYDDETSETNPLGMFGSAGVKWTPEEGAVYVHDTYNFPWRARVATRLPERPREMKIRGRINFNPEEGSVLLR